MIGLTEIKWDSNLTIDEIRFNDNGSVMEIEDVCNVVDEGMNLLLVLRFFENGGGFSRGSWKPDWNRFEWEGFSAIPSAMFVMLMDAVVAGGDERINEQFITC